MMLNSSNTLATQPLFNFKGFPCYEVSPQFSAVVMADFSNERTALFGLFGQGQLASAFGREHRVKLNLKKIEDRRPRHANKRPEVNGIRKSIKEEKRDTRVVL